MSTTTQGMFCRGTPLILALLVLSICLSWIIPSASAMTQAITPGEGSVLNSSVITFAYSTDLPGITGCTVTAGGFTFVDPDAATGQNTLQVQNVPDGVHPWSVTCDAGETSETSGTLSFTVDTQAPVLTLLSPTEGATVESIALTLVSSEAGTCTASWNDQQIWSSPVMANTNIGTTLSASGTGTFTVRCADAIGNAASISRQLTVQPQVYLRLRTEKSSYSLGETVHLTVEATNGSNVTVDVCPNLQGFVQCSSALITSTQFPQVITLPYMNKTGEYLVDGLVRFGATTRTNTTTYMLDNTLSVSIAQNDSSSPNRTINLTATAAGGFGPYRYDWKLHNGTVVQNRDRVTMILPEDGTLLEVINVTDAAGNKVSVTHEIVIRGEYAITILVTDNTTGAPIYGADVEMDGAQATTLLDGTANLQVDRGTHALFVSAIGYEYLAADHFINSSRTIPVRLRPKEGTPVVTILTPTEGAQVLSPTKISYSLTTPAEASCSLVLDGWENGTMQAQGGNHEFLRDLIEGTHTARVRCDTGGAVALSAQVSFTVVAPAAQQAVTAVPSGGEEGLQEALQQISAVIDSIGTYGAEERQAIELMGFDRKARNTKRAIQQAIRDIDGVNYREGLSEEARAAERQRILDQVELLLDSTPRAIDVTDSKSFVIYVEEETIGDAAEELAGLPGFPDDPDAFADDLLDHQQKFTVSTKAMHIRTTYADSEETSTVILRTFTYADELPEGMRIIEIIPKEIASDASTLELPDDVKVLRSDPVIEFPATERFAYAIPKKVDLERVERVMTVFAGRYDEETNALTGFAFLGVGTITGKAAFIIIVALLLYIAYYFDVWKQLKYMVYKVKGNPQVHYVSVLISDAEDQLAANDYTKAEMLYKEIRMTYDALPVPGKNELYERVLDLVQRMDVYYFNLVMIELDKHIKQGDMHAAIDAYEKLSGTFGRLDPERQEQLIASVSAIAKRLGVAA